MTEDEVPAIWQPGDVILDLYEVKEVHESGGMGLVYRVHHRGWNVDLAVKSPRPKYFISEQHRENFEREAETWVNLGLHQNVVFCHYVRRLGNIPRVFAEYVEGSSLEQWIRSGKLYEGGPERALERILDIAIQFAWGLHHAHERGLVHQDVKPANVMMTREALAKVTDFGLAKARIAAGEACDLSTDQSILVSTGGMTPAYCSPEQANRQPLSRRSDVWSWAVSVLHMFTGCITWPSGTIADQALEAHLEAGAGDTAIPPVPSGLVDLLRSCLRRDPAARPKAMSMITASLCEVYQQVSGNDYPREEPMPAEGLAGSLNNRAVSLLDLGKPDEAERLWEEALEADPHHAETIYNLGLVRWRSARTTDAIVLRQLQEIEVLAPDDWRITYMIAWVHLERDDCESAIRLLEGITGAAAERDEVRPTLATARQLLPTSRRCILSIQPPEGWVQSVFLSEDGGRLLVGMDNWLTSCDMITSVTHSFEAHTHDVRSVYASGDGRLALSGSVDKTLRLWEADTGRCLRTFEGHSKAVNSVILSGDGRLALSGSDDETLRLWEADTGRCLRTFEGPGGRVKSVSLSGDGRLALSASLGHGLRLWEADTGRCLRTFEGHASSVHSVSLSGDGRLALSGSDDKTLRLWEADTGRCLRTFEGHTDNVSSVSLSGDGRLALSGSWDHTLRLWEADTGRCLRTFEGHASSVHSVSLSGDGRLALSGSDDKTLRLWEADTGRCLRTFEGHTDEVLSVCLSGDGRLALSGGADMMLRLWDVTTGRCLRTFEGLTGWVSSVSLSGDGRLALSGSGDETLRLWDVDTGRCLRTFEGPSKAVNSVCLSGDGRLALSGSRDDTLRLWEADTGRCLRTFEGHTEKVSSVSLSGDGQLALSGSGDDTLRVWDVANGRCLHSLKGHTDDVSSVSLSGDGRLALSGSWDHTLRLWEVDTGRCLRTFEGHTEKVNSVSLSGDGRLALSGSDDKTLRLWEVDTGRCLRTFEGHTSWVSSVSLSGDGRLGSSGSSDLRAWNILGNSRLASAPFELSNPMSTSEALAATMVYRRSLNQARRDFMNGNYLGATERLREIRLNSEFRYLKDVLDIWNDIYMILPKKDFVVGWEAGVFEGHAHNVSSVSLSGDGRLALSGSWDHTLRLWEVDTGRCLRIFEGHTSRVKSVCLSGDGRLALSGSEGDFEVDPQERKSRTLQLWEVASGRCLSSFEGHTDNVSSVCLSGDGRLALSASSLNILLWDVATGQCLRSFEGLTARAESVCLSGDGRFALSGDYHRMLRLWDVAAGRCLRTFEGHTGWVNSVCLSGDGRLAVSGSMDKTIRLWMLDWELEDVPMDDWHEGARPYLAAFLAGQAPYAAPLPPGHKPRENEITLALTRGDHPAWTEEDFQRLLLTLGWAGYGWLRPEGIRRELEKMAANSRGPAPSPPAKLGFLGIIRGWWRHFLHLNHLE